MVEKREEKSKHTEEGIGIAGFVLGILSIIFFIGGAGIVIGIVGFSLCLSQQRKHPTRLGKIGLILNVIGFALGIIFLIAYTAYLFPKMQEIMQQSQAFPVA